jgi:hypothetical protein
MALLTRQNLSGRPLPQPSTNPIPRRSEKGAARAADPAQEPITPHSVLREFLGRQLEKKTPLRLEPRKLLKTKNPSMDVSSGHSDSPEVLSRTGVDVVPPGEQLWFGPYRIPPKVYTWEYFRPIPSEPFGVPENPLFTA